LFFTGLIPGLASGLGGPNLVRCYLVILPLYYFIAKAIYSIYKKVSLETEGLEYPLKHCINASTFTTALVLFIVLFGCGYFRTTANHIILPDILTSQWKERGVKTRDINHGT